MKADAQIELTVFRKFGGPLTKKISLARDGSIISDGSACIMATGEARRAPINNVKDLAALMANFKSSEALALGALRPGVSDRVKVTTTIKLNGAVSNDRIARTQDDIIYREGQPAFVLFDPDLKGMPPAIAAEIERRGGYWKTLCTIVPELKSVAHVTRRSTSTGLFNAKTGEKYVGSGGVHIYISVADGIDAERFLKALHDRCWLAGLGWIFIGAAGQSLERSIVDRSVAGAERLVFEGAPVLLPPLEQDLESRRPIAVEGAMLDTITACPPLTIVENARLRALIEKAKYKIAPEANKVRITFVAGEVKLLVQRTTMTESAAKRVVERQCSGVLLPPVVLPFDDPDFAGCTVGDVLADPSRFDGATLADPLEGIGYGRCKAMIMLRPNGTPWINSFAHGGTIYELKFDAASVRTAMDQADDEEVVENFVDLAADAYLDKGAEEELRNEAGKRSGTNKRTIAAMLKAAREDHTAERAKQARERREAERTDPRPLFKAPASDGPWLPQVLILNGVIGVSPADEPPARDIDDFSTRVRKLPIAGTHAFTDANAEEELR